MKQESSTKYLGVFIDLNLSWKHQIVHIATIKIKRSAGTLSKLPYYVNTDIFINLYYFPICNFLIYVQTDSVDTYMCTSAQYNLHNYIFQKKSIWTIALSSFNEHSTPLFIIHPKAFRSCNISNPLFMFKFHNNLLPSDFDTFLTLEENIHGYYIRSTGNQTYHLILTMELLTRLKSSWGKM